MLGTGGGPIEFSERMYHLYYTNQVKKASVYSIASGTIGTLSSEISMRFGLRGPSHVVSTGCASSTDALGYAFRSIKFGTASDVLAGGVDATVVRGIMEGFVMMRIVSTALGARAAARLPALLRGPGRLRARRGRLDVRARGARSRARAQGPEVYGEIRGYGATCDAHHRVRLDETGRGAGARHVARARGGGASARRRRTTSPTTAPRRS